jgi:hypothetical protein
MRQGHHRDDRAGALFIVQERLPADSSQAYAMHEAFRPFVTACLAVVIQHDDRDVDVAALERPRNRVPVAREHTHDGLRLLHRVERRAVLCRLAAEDVWPVFARHDEFRPNHERAEESIHALDVHRRWAGERVEELGELVEFVVGEGRGEGGHGGGLYGIWGGCLCALSRVKGFKATAVIRAPPNARIL